MAFRKKKESVVEPDSLNITPLIDCVFLLLIFFMVTTVFKNPAKLTLTLPTAENPSELQERHIVAELDEDGGVAINSKIVTFDTFDTYLLDEKAKTGNNILLIKADIESKHGDVLKLMQLARYAQIETIIMATDVESQEK